MYLSLAASKLSSFFLFSYSCYHIRYSFVPCKYIHVVITPPSSFIQSSPLKIAFVVASQHRKRSYFSFSFPCIVMKSGFTEAGGRGNARSGPSVPTPAAMSKCTGRMWSSYKHRAVVAVQCPHSKIGHYFSVSSPLLLIFDLLKDRQHTLTLV